MQALGDPTRRRMVETLSAGPLSVSALARPFAMSLTAVGQHLRILEACGLVATQKIGRVRTCLLNPAGVEALAQWVEARRSLWDKRINRLADMMRD